MQHDTLCTVKVVLYWHRWYSRCCMEKRTTWCHYIGRYNYHTITVTMIPFIIKQIAGEYLIGCYYARFMVSCGIVRLWFATRDLFPLGSSVWAFESSLLYITSAIDLGRSMVDLYFENGSVSTISHGRWSIICDDKCISTKTYPRQYDYLAA